MLERNNPQTETHGYQPLIHSAITRLKLTTKVWRVHKQHASSLASEMLSIITFDISKEIDFRGAAILSTSKRVSLF
jgi:hypothetical protein